MGRRFHTEHLEQGLHPFGFAVAASLIGEVRVAPPALQAPTMQRFPTLIRDVAEAFLANLQRGEWNGSASQDRHSPVTPPAPSASSSHRRRQR